MFWTEEYIGGSGFRITASRDLLSVSCCDDEASKPADPPTDGVD